MKVFIVVFAFADERFESSAAAFVAIEELSSVALFSSDSAIFSVTDELAAVVELPAIAIADRGCTEDDVRDFSGPKDLIMMVDVSSATGFLEDVKVDVSAALILMETSVEWVLSSPGPEIRTCLGDLGAPSLVSMEVRFLSFSTISFDWFVIRELLEILLFGGFFFSASFAQEALPQH
jgi:hypothetical protein